MDHLTYIMMMMMMMMMIITLAVCSGSLSELGTCILVLFAKYSYPIV